MQQWAQQLVLCSWMSWSTFAHSSSTTYSDPGAGVHVGNDEQKVCVVDKVAVMWIFRCGLFARAYHERNQPTVISVNVTAVRIELLVAQLKFETSTVYHCLVDLIGKCKVKCELSKFAKKWTRILIWEFNLEY